MSKSKYLVITTSVFLLLQLKVYAQKIIPSNTLPNNSTVQTVGNLSTINGGTVSGKNLFHSFSAFGIDNGNQVYFNNNLAITNIISRVIGGNSSIINGLISTNGGANLFLINPNGIVFGANAPG